MSFYNGDYLGSYEHNDKTVIVPKGTIIMMPMVVSSYDPDGFLRCDGRSLNIADYPDLYAVIATSFGGSGSTFNLPSFEEKFLYGKGAAGGTLDDDIGNDTHTLTVNNLPAHTHNFTTITHRHRKIISAKILYDAATAAGATVAYNDDLNNSSGGQLGFHAGATQAINNSEANSNGYGIGQASSNAYLTFANSGTSSPSSFNLIPKYIMMTYLIKY